MILSGEMYSFSSRLWFNNRRVKKNGEAALYLQVFINRQHKEFNLKLFWPVQFIDVEQGVLLPRMKKDPDINDFNLIIESERAKHFEIFRNYRIRKEPLDIRKFAAEINLFDQKESFISYIENERQRRYKRKEIDKKTWRNAHAVKMALMKYDPVCSYKNINVKWLKGFKSFLINSEYKEGQKYKPGTVWDRIKTVKAYLRLAAAEPLVYIDPDVLEFPNPKPDFETVFLNRDEIRLLMLLQESDLTHNQKRVLNAFLFTCFTSLRISDLYKANALWEIQEGFLDFIPKKNAKRGKKIRIPLLPIARSFIENTAGIFFDLPNEVEYNETLKELADKAGIKKRLTSHVGRHTFGYLFMTTVGNIYALQEILGHGKIDTTDRYSHLDDDYKMNSVKQIQKDFQDLMLKKIL